MKRRLNAIVGLLGLVVALGADAMLPSEIDVESGRILGTSGRSPDVRVFKGIPYAAPPIGANRWRPPAPAPSWEGTLSTREFGPRCTQGSGGTDTSEDCLHLNVWTTAKSADDRLPVMVWIHGGALTVGSGNEARYDGEALAVRGVVVVSINYRLGPFGFFAHPELSAESPHGTSGNYGFMDALAALEWIERNISSFGGDPNNVTVFGESAGARMTGALVGSPAAEGLFDRAVLQSGSWMGLRISRMETLDAAERAGTEAARRLGAASAADLRALSRADVLSALPTSRIVVDGRLIPEDLSMRFAAGRQNPVDMLIGSNKDEGTFFIRGPQRAEAFGEEARRRFGPLSGQFLSLYPARSDEEALESTLASYTEEVAWLVGRIAEWHADAGNDTYAYYFTREPPAPRPELGATHVAEVPYVFDHIPHAGPWTDSDRQLSDAMAAYWVNFASTGDPNRPGLPPWPRFDGGGVLELGGEIATVEPLLNGEKVEFFDAAFERLVN